MGPSGHFYSCIGLVTRDTGIPQGDGLSTRHPRIWGVTAYVTPRNFYRYKLGKIIVTGICIGISCGK